MIRKSFFKKFPNPSNAVCAIIRNKSKILLQKRDNKKNIFFPNHYGLFGGAIEKGENSKTALKRELREEIGLNFSLNRFELLNKMFLDFSPVINKKFNRSFYLLDLNDTEKNKLILGEGSDMNWFNPLYAYNNLKITPYDAYVICLYIYKEIKC